MEDCVYINKNSLNPDLCNEIIAKFEFEIENNNTRPGVTSSGFNIDVKHTTDFNIELMEKDIKWNNIHECLKYELTYNLKKYSDKMNSQYKKHKYTAFPEIMFFKTFQLQKYIQNVGKFIYHNDSSFEDNNMRRILTYIWYLNDVSIGGETEICNTTKIKPETGKLLIFPASWMYPHCGEMPVSNNKYIITGWVYITSN